MLYRGALWAYFNLHTYDFGDAAPSVHNSLGHWRRSLRHPFVRGKGGGGGEVLCPSFEQKDDTKITSSAGGYIRIARQWRFLVIMVRTWMPFYNVGKNVIGIKSNPTSFNSNQLLQLLGNVLTKKS